MSAGRDDTDEQEGIGKVSLLDLFRSEAESQVQVLNEGLLALEHDVQDLAVLEPLMRAAHSLKGAARVVNLEAIERIAHVMEHCFVAAQKGGLQLTPQRIDRLLAAVDLIGEIPALDEHRVRAWLEANGERVADLVVGLYEAADPARALAPGPATPEPSSPPPATGPDATAMPTRVTARPQAESGAATREEQVLRINVRRFDRLLALVSEARVTAHAFNPHLHALQRIRKKQHESYAALEQVRTAARADPSLHADLDALFERLAPLEQMLAERLVELDAYEHRVLALSSRMLDEVLALRMRPFRDGVLGFPRMVRDLARSLGKEAALEITGEQTLVDREVLGKMEAPLNQILRNAVDHGIEMPALRVAAGKAPAGTIRLEARHRGGMLEIEVADDGRGLHPDNIRQALVARGMGNARMAASMSNAELFHFLQLPGFSLKESASPISGRGVGLDVVAASVRRLNGDLHIESEPGQGFRTTIKLPLSQSLLRALVVSAAGEALAIPIANIVRVLRVPPDAVHALADRQFFTLQDRHVDLVPLAPLLELGPAAGRTDALPVVVLGNAEQCFGLVVDAILGEKSLAVHALDPVFGKLRNVSAAALLDDGSPVLILDSADLLQNIQKLAAEGGLQRMPTALEGPGANIKRVLVVDDSLTVREMERKLLRARGYEVDLAVDGMDGWNAVRSHSYDLVVTDVDMPRLDGIELVSLIKKDDRLRNLPVMIVSYKDRPEDRTRGIEAGADYYLTKGSFHDETLLEAVADLIGESGA